MPHFTSGKMKAQRLSHLPKIPQSQALKSLSLSHLPISKSCIPAFFAQNGPVGPDRSESAAPKPIWNPTGPRGRRQVPHGPPHPMSVLS